MSNVEIIQQLYLSFKNKDLQRIDQLCDKDIEWITMNEMPHGGTYVGFKAIFEDYFPKMLSNFKEFHAIPETFLDSKNQVVVLGIYDGISKTNKKFQVPFTHVYEIKENKIIKFRQFTDTQRIHKSLN
ncbi:Ketosteroid isomerase-related protein [metagenome]